MPHQSKKERVFKAKDLIEKGMTPREASKLTGIYIATARYLRDNYQNNKKALYDPGRAHSVRILH